MSPCGTSWTYEDAATRLRMKGRKPRCLSFAHLERTLANLGAKLSRADASHANELRTRLARDPVDVDRGSERGSWCGLSCLLIGLEYG